MFILNTDFEAAMSTEVLATSFFRDDADFKSRAVLCDGFGNHDTERLAEVLKEQYVPFTSEELQALSNVPAVIISREWFMDYYYGMDNSSVGKQTEFYNPTTLKNNHYLHIWGIKSTSPFENGVVFTAGVAPSVTAVNVSPAKSSLSAGLSLQLTATVTTTGFANKAVTWSITKGAEDGKAKINESGLLTIAKDYPVSGATSQIEVTATSIYNSTVTGKATITVL